nr:uncharacterized protein LOC113811934 [Penaeus vannamei]
MRGFTLLVFALVALAAAAHAQKTEKRSQACEEAGGKCASKCQRKSLDDISCAKGLTCCKLSRKQMKKKQQKLKQKERKASKRQRKNEKRMKLKKENKGEKEVKGRGRKVAKEEGQRRKLKPKNLNKIRIH